MKKILRIGLFAAALFVCGVAAAQPPVLIHSHNDYARRVPFYQAYAQQVASIEADVFLRDGKLLVGHEVEELSPDMTFEALYVEPVVTLFKRNGGRAWRDSDRHLQLMVELKSETGPTLRAVAEVLGRWPEVFDPAVNPDAVRVTVTGRVPEPADFGDYPAYIRFDGAWDAEYTPGQLERVALISADFKRFSQWNGKGSIIPAEREKLERVIDKAHAWDKPVRFWGAPEGVTVYYTFYDMGIDYINTDRPELCAEFFNDFGNKNFQIGERRAASSTVTGTKRLDKATRDFKGFQSDKLQLSKGIDVYTPTYRNDGGKGKVKNVIFRHGAVADRGGHVRQQKSDADGAEEHRLAAEQCAGRLYDRFGRRRQRPGYGRGACEPPYLGGGGRNGLSFAERLLLRPRPCRRRRDAGRHRRRHADGVLRPFGRARQFGRADRVAAERASGPALRQRYP